MLMANNGLALELSLPSTSSLTSPLTKTKGNNKALHHFKQNQATSFVALRSADNNMLSNFQERYLTYRYGKHKKIKAIYDQGAYYINYQQEWRISKLMHTGKTTAATHSTGRHLAFHATHHFL